MRLYGAPCKHVFFACRGRCLHETSPSFPRTWAGWASPKRFALPLRLTGQLGLMRSLSSPWTLRALSGEHAPVCLREAANGRSLLVAEGWSEPPAWDELAHGATPRAEDDADIELGEWRHGWQRRASRTRNLFFRDNVLLHSMPRASRARMRSQAGPHAGAWLTAIPSDPHTSLAPERLRGRLGTISTTFARRASRPVQGHARGWSPSASERCRQPGAPRSPQVAGASGSGSRSLRRSAICMTWSGRACGAPAMARTHHRAWRRFR